MIQKIQLKLKNIYKQKAPVVCLLLKVLPTFRSIISSVNLNKRHRGALLQLIAIISILPFSFIINLFKPFLWVFSTFLLLFIIKYNFFSTGNASERHSLTFTQP